MPKKHPQQSKKFPARQKSGRKEFIETISSSKDSPGHVESKKDSHAKNLRQRLSKLISIFTFSSKSSPAVIDCLLTDRQKKFNDIGAVFRSNSGKSQELKFSLMHSFPGKNPVVTWTSVFKTMQKFYAKSQKFSRSNSETKKKLFLKTCHLFRKFFWRQKLHFWQPSHKNARQKWKKIDTQSPKTYQKTSVYWSNFHLGKKHAISKVVSKNKTNSFILFRSRPENIQKVLFLVP